eukprot:Lithocolla_globosa_v1_NODE_60_length_7376_cov_322.464554.p9 type:complete len:130 gc:universal NODE_60_length_7376_cov_322.464554:6106-6495(+)
MCCMYDQSTNTTSVNELRRILFCKSNKTMEKIPLTQHAYLEHCNRAVYQIGIWAKSINQVQEVPSPEGFGWTLIDGVWEVVWTSLPPIDQACKELISCKCQSDKGCGGRCKCQNNNLDCTELCTCQCQK